MIETLSPEKDYFTRLLPLMRKYIKGDHVILLAHKLGVGTTKVYTALSGSIPNNAECKYFTDYFKELIKSDEDLELFEILNGIEIKTGQAEHPIKK